MTVDEYEGTFPLTQEEAYALPYTEATPVQVSHLRAYFGYTYEQARAFSTAWTAWFLAFYREFGLTGERSDATTTPEPDDLAQ